MKRLTNKVIACLLIVVVLFSWCGFAEIGSFFIESVQAKTTATSAVSTSEEKNKDTSSEKQEDVYVVDVVKDKCDEYTTVFLNSDGSYTANFYQDPVRYTDETGELVDIDTSITEIPEAEKTDETSGYMYTTQASPVETYLPEEITEDTPILVKNNNYSFSLVPITDQSSKYAKKSDSKSIDKDKSEIADENKTVVDTNVGVTSKEPKTDLYNKEEEKTTSITYNVTDEKDNKLYGYEYLPSEDGIKENIVLYQNTGINTFAFYLEVGACYAEINDSGCVIIYDNETKEQVGLIPAPYVTDATSLEDKWEGYGDIAHYELVQKEEGKYYLSVVVSEDFLNSKETTYPVTIDPSVTMICDNAGDPYGGSANPVWATYVMSGSYANTNFNAVRVMRCGYSSSMRSMTRTYILFPTIQNFISGKLVTGASFSCFETSNSSPYPTMTLERVTGYWAPWAVTWNNQPGSAYCGAGYSNANGVNGHYNCMDVTNVVANWATGAYPNYGLMLKATVESTSVSNRIDLYSSTTTATYYRPYLSVTYQEPANIYSLSATSTVTNNGYSDVSLTFNGVAGASRHYLYIYGTGTNNCISRDISGEISWNGSVYTWNSSGKAIFSGYTGLPNNAASVLGGNGSYTFKIYTTGPYTGVFGNDPTLTLPDNTSPNNVDTPSLSILNPLDGSGKINLTVTFQQTSDLPIQNASGIKEYQIKIYDAETAVLLAQDKVDYNASQSEPYNYTFTNLNDNTYYMAEIRVYDNNGNFTPMPTTVTRNSKENNTPPGAPQSVVITPSSWTNNSDVNVSWGTISCNNISSVKYSIDGGSEAFTERYDENQNFNLDISFLAEGTHTILLWAVDESGLIGYPSQTTIYKDTVNPTIDLSNIEDNQQVESNLLLRGLIEDTNLVSWQVEVKDNLLSTYIEVLSSDDISATDKNISGSGTDPYGTIGTIDLTNPDYHIGIGDRFYLKITATDAAGLQTVYTMRLTREESASNIAPVFEIDNILNTTDDIWYVGTTTSDVALIGIDNQSVPSGTTRLFVDNTLSQDTNGDMAIDISDATQFAEGSVHHALVRVTDSSGNITYNVTSHHKSNLDSQLNASEWTSSDASIAITNDTASLNGVLSGSMTSNAITTSGNLTEFILYSDESVPSGTDTNYYVQLQPNGTFYEVDPNVTYNVDDTALLNGSIDCYGITVKVEMSASDTNTAPSISELTLDTTYVDDGESFTVSMLDGIAPTDLNITENVNYMTYLRWDAGVNADTSVTYNIYRSDELTTLYDSSNAIATGISETYWYDYNLQYSKDFYYGVKAVKTIDGVSRESISDTYVDTNDDPATVTIVDQNEVEKHLGLQNYWGYTPFSTVTGSGYVEQSSGNLVYQETDAQVPGTLLGLVLKRTYNSQSTTTTALGSGWDFSFNTTLYVSYDTYGNEVGMILKDGDGTFHFFEKYTDVNGNTAYQSPDGIHMQLSYVNGHFEIYRYDNITYVFNSSNQLASMSEPNGNAIRFEYDSVLGNLMSVTSSNGDAISFTYDTMNRVTEALLPDGSTVCYSYTTSGSKTVLDTVTLSDAANENALIRTYDYTNGMLTTIPDGMHHDYDLSYTAENQLDQLTYPNGDVLDMSYTTGSTTTTLYTGSSNVSSTSSCTYNAAGNVSTTTDPSGQEITYTYDPNYNLTSLSYQYNADAFDATNGLTHTSTTDTYSYAYDDQYNVTSITAPDGLVTTYDGYTTLNKPTGITISKSGCASINTAYEYDVYGNLIETTDPSDATTTSTYDTNGNLTSAGDRYGNITYYTYNSEGQLTQTTLSTASVSILSYDAMWRPLLVQDANGVKTEYTYDYRGNVATVTEAPDTPSETTYTYNYNNNNQISYITDPMNQRVDFSYDCLGRNTGYTIGGKTWATTYSNDTITLSDIAFLGEDLSTTIDINVTKVTTKLPNGDTLSESWYDASGRLVKQTGSGTSVSYFYDDRGYPIKSVDITGAAVRVIYDKNGKQTQAIVKNGDSYIATSTAYDYLGNTISTTDGTGATTTYTYDSLSRLTSASVGGTTTSYTYDNVGYGGIYNETIDANGRKSISVFNALGDKIAQIEFADSSNTTYKTTSFAYDGNGNLSRQTNADGSVVEYTYDAHGNVTQKVQKASVSATESAYRTVYIYDADGRRTLMTDYQTVDGVESEITKSSYGYDALGRVTQYIQDGSPVSYTYNDDGTVASITYPAASVVPVDGNLGSEYFTIQYNYEYNGALNTNQLSAIKAILPNTTTPKSVRDYTYTNGRVSSITDYVGFDTGAATTTAVTENVSYNDLGLVSSLEYIQAQTQKESYSYTYDNRGYITSESIINNYFDTPKNATFTYSYDTIGRLTASAYTDNTTSTTTNSSYTYDAVGNRLSNTKAGVTTSYTIGAYNQITSVSSPTESSTFTYDANGNTTSEINTTNEVKNYEGNDFDVRTTLTKNYAYDYTNMMASASINVDTDAKLTTETEYEDVSNPDETASDSYIYNGDGQRVKKITGTETTKYYYTGSVVLYTADADNYKISGNIPTPSGQIIATRDYAYAMNADDTPNAFANNYYFYHYDIRGSVTTLLKPDATLEQGYSYDEFGNASVANATSLLHNEISYTGAISDKTTGLSYMNARYYNPATGTFTSQDTYLGSANNPWTQHLYSYTGGNPVNFTDPTGHRPIKGDERLDGNKSTGHFDAIAYYEYRSHVNEDEDEVIYYTSDEEYHLNYAPCENGRYHDMVSACLANVYIKDVGTDSVHPEHFGICNCWQCKNCNLVMVTSQDPTLGYPAGYFVVEEYDEPLEGTVAFVFVDKIYYTDLLVLPGYKFRNSNH